MFKRKVSPGMILPMAIFGAALLLQGVLTGYLLGLTGARSQAEFRRLQVQISGSLAGQLARALADKDDLAALAGLRDARAVYPQLREAMVFDSTGRILLHTDSGLMGKSVNAPQGPRLTSPEISLRRDQGRPLASVLVPLPDQDDGYLRVVFDETRYAQGGQAVAIRGVLLAAAFSALLALLVWQWQRRSERIHALQRAAEPAEIRAKPQPDRIAQLLLAGMPHAALAINRDNRILAANPLALELLNCRAEELETLHIINAPLPPAVVGWYQGAMQAPEKPLEARMTIMPKTPELTARAVFVPPSGQWELAVLSFR